jgi:hypothetical protein
MWPYSRIGIARRRRAVGERGEQVAVVVVDDVLNALMCDASGGLTLDDHRVDHHAQSSPTT